MGRGRHPISWGLHGSLASAGRLGRPLSADAIQRDHFSGTGRDAWVWDDWDACWVGCAGIGEGIFDWLGWMGVKRSCLGMRAVRERTGSLVVATWMRYEGKASR